MHLQGPEDSSYRLGLAVAGGASSVALSLLSSGFLSLFFGYFVPLPLYCLGLGAGLQALWAGSLVAIALQVLLRGTLDALVYAAVHALPAVIICKLALGRNPRNQSAPYPGGYLVSWYTGLAMVALFGVFVVLNNYGHRPEDLLENLLKPALENKPAVSLELLDGVSAVFPGLVGASWVLMGVVNCYLAQRLLQKYSRNLRTFNYEYDVRFHQWWDIILVAGLLLTRLNFGQIDIFAKNIVIIACIPLYISGVNVIYKWVKKNELSGVWLIFVMLTSVIFVWPAMFIVGLGFVQPWLKYFNK